MKEVDKISALKAVKPGPMSLAKFAERLIKEGFEIKGPRKAYNIMIRLHRQGLVRRTASVGELRYELPATDGPVQVSRRQVFVTWEITERGVGRLKYLSSHSR